MHHCIFFTNCCSICIKVVCVSQGFRCFPTSRGTSAALATEKGHKYLTQRKATHRSQFERMTPSQHQDCNDPNKNNCYFLVSSYSLRVPKLWCTKRCSSQCQGTGSSTPITCRWSLCLAWSYGVLPCDTQLEVQRPDVDGCGAEFGTHQIQIVSFSVIAFQVVLRVLYIDVF